VTTAQARRAPDGESGEDGGGDVAPVIALVPAVPDAAGEGRFEEVYRSSYPRMTRIAFLMTGSNETAEEVVQDAFVALYQRLDDVAEPAGYLYRSVVNGCRARRRRQAVAERLGAPRPRADVLPPDLDETWQALRQVAPRRRAALVLRYYADLPLAEIARTLECSTGTVKSLIHRGLAQLKEVIEP
jgi:RNA polymerase sigma factor (sigma-70 family)